MWARLDPVSGEKPAQLAQGIEQPETKGAAALQNDDKSHERPPSLAAFKVSSEVSAPVSTSPVPGPVPSQRLPTTKLSYSKSETESKHYNHMKESLSRNQRPQTPSRAPQNSKISLALRRLRSRPSAVQ